jgi:AraC family transcriptional regulator of adaptative response / DNA-3-methyladenine glycosylase II
VTADPRTLYQALSARDARFDGVFFVGVTSTGIYCRPVCPARTPRRANCRFFASAEEAEQARFRPCLRCRPELAPGLAPVDDAQRIAHAIVEHLEDGTLDAAAGLEAVADRFELSSRQLRRIVRKELGVAPIQLVLTRRLLLAKQLLTETALPVTEVAFASGFQSLRRFNDAFAGRYRMPPRRLRRQAGATGAAPSTTLTLRLGYRAPFDWPGMLAFLRARQLAGVEWVTDDAYARTVRLGARAGWIRVARAEREAALALELSQTLTPALPVLLRRVRALFDLEARPDVIARHLRRAAVLAPLVDANPGLRVPGAFDGFELGVRAILGQQVTVKAATTLAARLVGVFGEPIATPHAELTRLAPTPARLARARVDDLAALGIPGARCGSLVALARAHVAGSLSLDGGAPPDVDATLARLTALPGIGPWTAHYIAMRALRWPDAFPRGDAAVLASLGGVTAAEAEEMSRAWRPWRSYAVLHLWRRPALTPQGLRRSAVSGRAGRNSTG